jgi:hypothetical protein
MIDDFTDFMKIGQPNLSEVKGQRSWLFVQGHDRTKPSGKAQSLSPSLTASVPL